MYLVDTNILIYYLAGEPNCVAFVQRHADQILISAISVIEVLSYNFADDGLTIAKQFLSSFEWLYIDEKLVFETGKQRRLKKMKTPDAIIGTTALYYELILVTNNVKDFKHLPIELINPMLE